MDIDQQDDRPEVAKDMVGELKKNVISEPTRDVVCEPPSDVVCEPPRDVVYESTKDVATEPTKDVANEPMKGLVNEPATDVANGPTKDATDGLTKDVTSEPMNDVTIGTDQEKSDDDFVVGQVLDSVVNNSSQCERDLEENLNEFLVYDDDYEDANSGKENLTVALVEPEETAMNGVEQMDYEKGLMEGQPNQIYGIKDPTERQEGKEAEVFVVEKILDKKIGTNGSIKYLVKWLNYPSRDNSWEPVDNLIDCCEAMIKFELERAKKVAKRHEDDNGLIEQEDPNKRTYRKSLEFEVNDIMGLVKVGNERYFLTSLANSTRKAFVRASLANVIFPTKVIDFYIKNMRWKPEI